MHDDTADARAGQISNRAECVRGRGDDRDARREQSFLSASADAGDDYLAAVAFDLSVGKYHKPDAAHRIRRPAGTWARAYSITFFSIGSTVTPLWRSHASARSICSLDPSNSTATRPISSETLAPRMLNTRSNFLTRWYSSGSRVCDVG